MTLKEAIIERFNYCNAIAMDIIANGKSKEVQEYAKQYAEIESPLVGGTSADWIRINWGDIYIFLHDNGNIQYQLDPVGAYNEELIDMYGTSVEFIHKINSLKEDEIQDDYYYPSEYHKCNPRDGLPLKNYIPMHK